MTEKLSLFRFPSARRHDPAVAAWFEDDFNELYVVARKWFDHMRRCGSDVTELLHDGCPTACAGDAAFGYVAVFKTHVNIGFFPGTMLPDPGRLLAGNGKRMRHVRIVPGQEPDEPALQTLINDAYRIVKAAR